MQCFGTVRSEAAVSTISRTGVFFRPTMTGFVMSAPSQWNMLMISAPEMPGKRYLFPPENPTTSCGKVGPTIRSASYS